LKISEIGLKISKFINNIFILFIDNINCFINFFQVVTSDFLNINELLQLIIQSKGIFIIYI